MTRTITLPNFTDSPPSKQGSEISPDSDIKTRVGQFIHKQFGHSKRISQTDKKMMEKWLSEQIHVEHKRYTFNSLPNKPWLLRVCNTSLLKTLREKEKLLITSNFSFSHSVFYPFGKLSAIFIKLKIVVCKPFEFGRV